MGKSELGTAEFDGKIDGNPELNYRGLKTGFKGFSSNWELVVSEGPNCGTE